MADEVETPEPVAISEPRSALERMAQKAARKIAETHKANTERDAALKEAEDLRKQIADLAKSKTEADALKEELRGLKHRKVADQVLHDAGINPNATEAFYKLTDMKFEGDEPDPAKVKAFVEAEKPKFAYLFNSGESGQTEEGEGSPAPGRGRGGTAANGHGPFQATREQLRDPAWCFEHQTQLAKASKEVMNMPISKVSERFIVQ